MITCLKYTIGRTVNFLESAMRIVATWQAKKTIRFEFPNTIIHDLGSDMK